MQDTAAETNSSSELDDVWPTTTARVISVLGLVGLVLSIILAAAQYFETGGAVAELTMVIVCFYTLSVRAARPGSGNGTDKEKLADLQAGVTGIGLSWILVLLTLLAVRRDQPLILPAAFLHNAGFILLAPIFTVPLFLRVWRKGPYRR